MRDADLRVLRRSADSGDAEAQFQIAGLFLEGEIGQPSLIVAHGADFKHALHWLKLAAAQGHLEAMNSLGVRYNRGEGVTQDHQDANRWFAAAAASDHLSAMCNLAINIERGLGAEREISRAVALYENAASKMDATAHYRLGVIFAEGTDVAKDAAKAFRHFEAAAQLAYPNAFSKLAHMLFHGECGIPEDREAALMYALVGIKLGNRDCRLTARFLGGRMPDEVREMVSQHADAFLARVAPKP